MNIQEYWEITELSDAQFIRRFADTFDQLTKEGVVSITPEGPQLRIDAQAAVGLMFESGSGSERQVVVHWLLAKSIGPELAAVSAEMKREGLLRFKPAPILLIPASEAFTEAADPAVPFLRRGLLAVALEATLFGLADRALTEAVSSFLQIRILAGDRQLKYLVRQFGTADWMRVQECLLDRLKQHEAGDQEVRVE
jgi:hypothetical protein